MKKLLLSAATLVTAIALFYAWENWSGARGLRAALAQLDGKKEPARLEDFVPPPVPDERNVAAAPIFREVFTSQDGSRLAALALPWKSSARPSAGQKLAVIAKEIAPSFSGDEASAGRVILGSLEPSGPVLEEVREVLRRPQVCWPLDYSKGFSMLLPQIGPMMKAAKVFHARAVAELAAGLPRNAFEDIRALFALAEASGSPRLLIGELVRISILSMAVETIGDGLGRGVWSDGELAAFSESLARINLPGEMADALRVERAMALRLDWGDPLFLLDMQGESVRRTPAEKLLNATWRLRPSGWSQRDKAQYLLLIQRMIDALGSSGRISPDEFANIDSLCQNVSLWSRIITPLTWATLPAVQSVAQRAVFAQTLAECTLAACAAERFRLANNRLPDRLGDLVPAFLGDVPKDPITGAPLIYKPSQDGSFLIYGTGWNRSDDGGSLKSPQIDSPQKQLDWGILVSRRLHP